MSDEDTSTQDISTTSFTGRLRATTLDDWQAAVGHRFVEELFAGTLDDAVLARYLVQDYQFFDPFLRLLGEAITTAPDAEARLRLARQMGMLATVENGYFEQSFDRLGVPADDRRRPRLTPETLDLVALMQEAIASHSWPEVLAVLVVLEWIYLAWAEHPDRVGEPERPEHRDWIDLHRGDDFHGWVGFLRDQLDDAEPQDPGQAERCRDLFARTVRAEVAFFEGAYRTGAATQRD